MASIHGRYVYDEGLTPGRKKEGGLHQNLFDADGHLKGSARFIPDEEQPSDDDSYSWLVSSPADDAKGTALTDEELERIRLFIDKVVFPLLVVAIQRGAPYAQLFWQEKVRPALRARLDGITRRRLPWRRRPSVQDVAEVLEGTVVEAPSDLQSEATVELTAAEAEARRQLALAMREASDEQLRLLAAATIVDDQGTEEGHKLHLPTGQDAAHLLVRWTNRPGALTGGEVLTAMQLLLGSRGQDARQPIEIPREADRQSDDDA